MKNSRAEAQLLSSVSAPAERVKESERSQPHLKTENAPLEVKVVTRETEFLMLRDEWEKLVEQCPVHVYQLFAWQWFWWKHYGTKFQLHIITFRRSGALVGIIPLFLQKYYVCHHGYSQRDNVMYSRLRMLGCGIASKENRGLPAEYGPSDYLDIIVLPENGVEVAKEFSAYLAAHADLFDEVHFQDVPQQSALNKYIVPELKKSHWECNVAEGEICPYLAAPQSMEKYLDVHPNLRHRVNQVKKEFVAHPPFSIETIETWSSFASAYRDLVQLHQLRWNRLGYAGLFSDHRFTQFQSDVLSAFYKQRVLWFKAVRFAGVRIALRVGFIFKGRCYDYLSGFDDTAPGAKKSPSRALLLTMIENAIQSKVRVVDFLRGTEQYKFELATGMARNVDIHVFNPQTRKTLRVMLYRLVRIVGKTGRRISDEWKLLSVQLYVHGAGKFLFMYIQLFVHRLTEKLFQEKFAPADFPLSLENDNKQS